MQTVTEILIDFSTSMNDKLAFTKTMLHNQVIPNLDFSAKIGIKTFTATNNKIPDIKTVLALSIIDKEQLTKAVNTLTTPSGNTPIAAAIKSAVNSLKEYSAFDKKIILITDGEENCGGDYQTEVENARKDGINCQIHIIGLGLTGSAIQKAERISSLSSGSFCKVPFMIGTTYSNQQINAALSPLYAAMRPKPGAQTNTFSPPFKTTNQNILTGSPLGAISQPTLIMAAQSTNEAKVADNKTAESIPLESIVPFNPLSNKTETALTSEKIKETLTLEGGLKPEETQPVNNQMSEPNEKDEDIIAPPTPEPNNTAKTLNLLMAEIREMRAEIKAIKKPNSESEIIEDEVANKQIGRSSEAFLFEYLQKKYPNRVKWLNEQEESGADHDFEILDLDGSIEYYIECKGTGNEKSSFLLTKNEWRLFLNHTKNYQLYFIKNCFDTPKAIFIDNVLDWLLKGKLLPYLLSPQALKQERIPLSINEN